MIARIRQPRIRTVRFSGPVTGCAITMTTLLLAGCRAEPTQHKPPAGVPESAKLVSERSGAQAFIATDNGTAYIYDTNAGRIVYRTLVNYQDKLWFYPQKNQIILNGTVVKEDRNLNEDHVHRLYFVKG